MVDVAADNVGNTLKKVTCRKLLLEEHPAVDEIGKVTEGESVRK